MFPSLRCIAGRHVDVTDPISCRYFLNVGVPRATNSPEYILLLQQELQLLLQPLLPLLPLLHLVLVVSECQLKETIGWTSTPRLSESPS